VAARIHHLPHLPLGRVLLRVEALKKWDWLRAETAKTLENRRARRCLSQFFHSLGETNTMLDRNIDDKKIRPAPHLSAINVSANNRPANSSATSDICKNSPSIAKAGRWIDDEGSAQVAERSPT
jgi:hypothetical protein